MAWKRACPIMPIIMGFMPIIEGFADCVSCAAAAATSSPHLQAAQHVSE